MTNYWEHSLQDRFEYEGLWWRPDEPDDRVPGILSYDSNEGTTLKLLGTFRGIPFFTTEAARLRTINGLTVDGVECTLSDVLEAGRRSAFPGISTQSFTVNTLLLGEAVAELGAVRFTDCQLSLEHLEAWITPRVFEVDYAFENRRLTRHTTKVISRMEFEEKIKAIGAVVSMGNGLSVENNHPSQVVQRSEVFLRIQPAEPQPYDTFISWVVELSRLFSIIVGDYCSPRSIKLNIELSNEADESRPQLPASAFYRRALNGSGERLSSLEMPVEFSVFARHVVRILDSWFSFEEKAKSVSDLFFTSVYSDTHQVNRFLSLVHALESYHRNRHGGFYVEPEIYADYEAKIVDAFPSELPPDLRQALKSRIKFGNQYSLRKRVGLLLRELDDDLRALITDSPDQFTDEIVDTRNYHVHYDDEDSGEVLDPLEMLLANQQLELFVRVLLMRELGFTDKEIYSMLSDKLKLLPTIRIPRKRETSKAD